MAEIGVENLAIESGSLKTSYEKHRHDEYSGIIQSLEEMTTFVRTSGGRRPQERGKNEFQALVNNQNRLVQHLADLQEWNEQTIRTLEEIKRDFITLTGFQDFEEANNGRNPHTWWGSMVGEAFFKRVWPSVYLVSGDENQLYSAVQEELVDQAGIDFLDLVEYEGDDEIRKKFLVCTQFKTSIHYPVGQILMVDLLNPSSRGESTMHNVHMDSPTTLERVRNAAFRAQTLLGKGDETVAVILVVLGMKDKKNRSGSWKTIIREADEEATRVYFADQLDSVLSGETEYFEPRKESNWYDNLFEKKKSKPTRRGEAEYRQYAAKYQTHNLVEEPTVRQPV